MKFSVILPIYNVEKYLGKCVESILAQTFTDYELILVDDGAKDNSPAICDEYAKKDARIKVIHQVNGGQSNARNNGLDVANGEYVIYIDSDDFIMNANFLKNVSEKTCQDVDMIFYKYCNYYEESSVFKPCQFSYIPAMTESATSEIIKKLVMADAFYGQAWIRAIRRKMLTENGVKFMEGISCEDTDWNYNIWKLNPKVVFIDEPYIAYRQREGSVSRSTKLKLLKDFFFVVNKWAKELREIENAELKGSLLASLAKYYSNLLVIYMRVQDVEKKEYKQKIKALSWLLDYSENKRPMMVSKVYRLLGFDATIMMLNLLDKVKK